jgi:hypothetical protein
MSRGFAFIVSLVVFWHAAAALSQTVPRTPFA